MKTFEEYLQEQCFEENPTVLDDDMPDYFDDWVSDIPTSAVMIYANGWMNQYKSEVRKTVHEIIK